MNCVVESLTISKIDWNKFKKKNVLQPVMNWNPSFMNDWMKWNLEN